jgi:mercuric reductase
MACRTLTSDLPTVDESIELRELPASLLIIGGVYIALELGWMFSRFGTAVTMLERGRQLLNRNYEPEVGRSIGDVFAQEGIQVILNAAATSVRQDGTEVVMTAVVAGRERQYRTERVLVATGRRPNTDNIAIDHGGVQVNERSEVVVDTSLRTNVRHIYAASDVIGRQHGSQMATPIGSRQGGIAARNALSAGPVKAIDHRVIPRVIFTDPEVAVVGMTEAEAIAAGHRCWCNTLPMSLVPRAAAIRDTRGIIKMTAGRCQ